MMKKRELAGDALTKLIKNIVFFESAALLGGTWDAPGSTWSAENKTLGALEGTSHAQISTGHIHMVTEHAKQGHRARPRQSKSQISFRSSIGVQ